MKSLLLKLAVGLAPFVAQAVLAAVTVTSELPFRAGSDAYAAGDFEQAVRAFRDSVAARLSAGGLANLGNAEWQLGRTGEAILAWERALWLNPFEPNARNNLRYARAMAQLEPPELRWYEVASAWLPVNCWAWIAGISLWLVVGLLTLPEILRWRRTPWQQAVAALGLGVFLLGLPAHWGVLTRARLGVVMEKDTPLRLTPTSHGEAVTRLAAGESARFVRSRGSFVFIRTNRAAGWVERSQFKKVCEQAE